MTVRERSTFLAAALLLGGCGPREVKPVEIFPEDMCAFCRMAVSDHRFASEIVTREGEVFKFDDLGCLAQYRTRNPALDAAAVFVKDFESGAWIPEAASTIVEADVSTPMGSGRVAFRSAEKARLFASAHARDVDRGKDPCCAPAAE